MARKENPISSFMLENQFAPEHWPGWQGQELAEVTSGDTGRVAVALSSRLAAGGVVTTAEYLVIHDRDSKEVWSDADARLVRVLKEKHLHGIYKLSKPMMVSAIADALGVPPMMIEKPRSGRYSWDNFLAYLIHAKDSEKYSYAPSDVVTTKGPDYIGVHAENQQRWEKARALKTTERNKDQVEAEWLRQEVLAGRLTKRQLTLDERYFAVYAVNRNMLDEALDSYAQRRAALAALAMERGEFATTVVYVQGQSGSGKSSWAKDLVSNLTTAVFGVDGRRWEAYKVAPRNPIDNYRGEEVVVMDDIRGNSLDAVDWLRLLDPHEANPAAARYANKEHVAPRLIVITSVQSPEEFFYFTKGRGSADEPMDQFMRRLTSRVEVLYDDDQLTRRFDVGHTGRRQPYQFSFTISGSRGVPDRSETLSLTYGVTAAQETDAEGAIREVLGLLQKASSDLSIPDLQVITTDNLDRADEAHLLRKAREVLDSDPALPGFSEQLSLVRRKLDELDHRRTGGSDAVQTIEGVSA